MRGIVYYREGGNSNTLNEVVRLTAVSRRNQQTQVTHRELNLHYKELNASNLDADFSVLRRMSMIQCYKVKAMADARFEQSSTTCNVQQLFIFVTLR